MVRLYLRKGTERINPTSARICFSGNRFASYVELGFEDTTHTFSPNDWRDTFEVWLDPEDGSEFDTFLYLWGGDNAAFEQRGESTVFTARLTIGQYRANPAILHISNEQLDEILATYFEHYLTGCISLGTATNLTNVDDEVTATVWLGANTLAVWSGILEYGKDIRSVGLTPDEIASGGVRTLLAGYRLQKLLTANIIALDFYDDRAAQMWEKFNVLSVLDLPIQSLIGPSYTFSPAGITPPANLNSDYVCVPDQPMRGPAGAQVGQPVIALVNTLDAINTDDLDELLVKSYTRNWKLEITGDEPIVYQYKEGTGQDADYIGVLNEGFNQTSFDAWKRNGVSDRRLPLLPYRFTANLWRDKNYGMFEAILHRHNINKGNRTAKATVITPSSAEELAAITPGNPVLINGRGYWVLECNVRFPDGTTDLELFDPAG